MMTDGNSVTMMVIALKSGNLQAAQGLWEAYFGRLVGLARKRLGDSSRAVADEEDVALSAFDSVCRGVQSGRFPRLDDRDDLWQILVLVTVRKVVDLRSYHNRRSRGGGRVRTLSDLAGEDIEIIGDAGPTPEMAAQVAEECQRLLAILEDDSLQRVAGLKLEGYTNEEIAAMMGCVTTTVERKLARIRSRWSRDLEDES
jgi:RNA polymerase sigma factor (sigma-70 family)